MSEVKAPRAQKLLATTPWSETDEAIQLAMKLAQWFGCPYVSRYNRSIVNLCETEQVDAVLIADRPPKLVHRLQPMQPLFFHPGMAMQRVLGLLRGQSDRLLQAARIQPGDIVFDATLGLGADSIVFAAGVGPTGRVRSCESSVVLARLFAYAAASRWNQPEWLAPLLSRIEVMEEDYCQVLKTLPDKCVDVVYFDPMFRTPSSQPSSIDRLRLFAERSPLTDEAVLAARRVARRAVVVKERLSSGLFHRYGLQPDKPRARFSYGVLEP